jgi:hypothetical protein
MLAPEGRQGGPVSEVQSSSGLSVRPQPVGIDTSVGLRVLVSKIHFVYAGVRMGKDGEGAQVSGGKLGIQGVRGQAVGEDPDMVTNLVEGSLCHRRRMAVLPS